ncbi:MAG TPA: hypothetical protein DER64_13870, partial [Planctomycetaceae bacterium]|nr:hypothetical protein [Planctomycetaceae bacterium]
MAMLFLAMFAMVGGCRTPQVAVVDEPQVDPMTQRLSERLKREVDRSRMTSIAAVKSIEKTEANKPKPTLKQLVLSKPKLNQLVLSKPELEQPVANQQKFKMPLVRNPVSGKREPMRTAVIEPVSSQSAVVKTGKVEGLPERTLPDQP